MFHVKIGFAIKSCQYVHISNGLQPTQSCILFIPIQLINSYNNINLYSIYIYIYIYIYIHTLYYIIIKRHTKEDTVIPSFFYIRRYKIHCWIKMWAELTYHLSTTLSVGPVGSNRIIRYTFDTSRSNNGDGGPTTTCLSGWL